LAKRILLVGPINSQGIGGRFEEMKVWASCLHDSGHEVSVFSMFNSGFAMGSAEMNESVTLMWPNLWHKFTFLRAILIRVWGSRWFKNARDNFYTSKVWLDFASIFDHIILFITHQSKELVIFESGISRPVSVRFTGTIHDFTGLNNHGFISQIRVRKYVFHSSSLSQNLNNSIPKIFIDQATLSEKKLINIQIDGNAKIFGMIGLFMEVKQMGQVIEIFQEFPHFKLVLFGTGALQSQFEELIRKKNLKNVKIAGFFPPTRIDEMYASFDCLIINSDEETGPMTGIEAMASGKLIFSRPIGAMPDRLEGMNLIYRDRHELMMKLQNISKLTDHEIFNSRMSLRSRFFERYSLTKLKSSIESLVD
jgi:glycosyltransferase involved in cell wall biosynthesis